MKINGVNLFTLETVNKQNKELRPEIKEALEKITKIMTENHIWRIELV